MHCIPVSSKVLVYWRLADEHASRSSDKPLLRINLDETSSARTPESPAGLVVFRSVGGGPGGRPGAPCKKGDSRGDVTYVALICDNSGVQPRLPHFVIGSEHIFTQALMAERRARCPGNMHLWRAKSPWNTAVLTVKLLEVLAKTLVPLRNSFNVVLILDVASCHIDEKVMKQAARLGIRLIYVPARSTDLVQPLDTHAFARFKKWFREQFQLLRQETEDGEVSVSAWTGLLMRTPRKVCAARQWKAAFTHTGASAPRTFVTKALTHVVGNVLAEASHMPPMTPEGLNFVWPTRRRMTGAFNLLLPSAGFVQPALLGTAGAAARVWLPTNDPVSESIALSSCSNVRACRQFPVRQPVAL